MSTHSGPRAAGGQPSFSLFFFSDDRERSKEASYHLVLEAAKFADAEGFDSIWVPERHFNKFGALYPNPSVLAAGISTVTENVGIRAGSVVVPLHHPVRVAEEWAMVDNLSRGRVGIAAASGWSPGDTFLSDADFGRRREETFERVDTVRRLWRGERADVRTPRARREDGEEEVLRTTYPRPVQPELPTWIATVGTRETWVRAGECGHHILTALVATTLDDIADHVRAYRAARAGNGHAPDAGRVTMMIHTFLGPSDAEVRATVHEPLVQYIETHINQAGGHQDAPDAAGKRNLAEFAFERYYTRNGLFGTPETALPVVDRLLAAGVDEIACLIDFGVEDEAVLQGLPYISMLRKATLERHGGGRR
ncbi:LLM class flavin-dependent oxidoreductase [Streptomyces albiaxialis]|uniref:LLM class flavin-dependent oxidoreductase n=1 Tax=Streptomyces albiaxialis TaxID=329523 RepID=A0ABN2WXV1_9ACTN